MQPIKNFLIKNKKVCIIFIFILLYIFGLTFLKEVGVNYDEGAEQEILEMNVLEYALVLDAESDLVKYYEEKGIIPIYQSVEKDHGIAPYYLFTPFLTLRGVSDHTLSYAWHFYTFTLSFLGTLFLYFLIKELWQNDKVALLTAIIFFFTPRIFADSLYNNKDCVLLTFITMCMYFGVRFLKNKNYKNAILFGITSAIACNLKISGFYVFGIIGLFYLFILTKEKEWNKKNFLVGLTALASCLFLFILLTPAIWAEGFHLIEYFKWCLENSVRFSRNWGRVWFESTAFEHSTNPLPWYYVPKIMCLTIPIYILILFILSVIYKGKEIRNKVKKDENKYFILSFILFFVPILVAMVSNPNIYNGWRHFYFLYAPLMVLVSFGLLRILEHKKYQKWLTIVIIACIFIQGLGIIKNGTYSSVYYNKLAKDPSTNYEMDYYGVTATKALQDLAKTNEEKIYLYGFEAYSLEANYRALEKKYKEKIVLIYTEEELESIKKQGIKPMYYEFLSYDLREFEALEGTELKKEYKSWGNTFIKIYQ